MANKIGFGAQHLNLPTPANISRAVTIASVLLPVFIIWINSDNNLFGPAATRVIVSLSTLVIALINVAKPFFGIQINPDSEVAAKDIQSMENK